MRKLGVVIGVFLVASCSQEPPPQNQPTTPLPDRVADTVFKNGRIYTVNEIQPWVEALAIKDGRFLAVGLNADIESVTGDGTEVVDLGGRFVMPGINDLHHHGMDTIAKAA